MRPSWFKISALLAGVWLVLGATIWWLNERRPSPEKLVAFAMAHRVADQPAAEHAALISAVAAEYHRLDMSDRGALLATADLKPWWQELTKPERFAFRSQLFPQTLKVAEFFDTFSPEQRQTNLQRLMGDVHKRGGDSMMPDISPQVIGMIKNYGLKPFVQGPMLDDKFEFLLVFYEMEKRIVWRRR